MYLNYVKIGLHQLLLVCFVIMPDKYIQDISIGLKGKKIQNREITVHLSEKVSVNDSLSIFLESFSHKRPMKGGPTKSTAHLVVSKEGHAVKISLSKHGIEGKTEECDGVSENERYDTINCFGYTIKLRELVYNQSITIKIEDVKKT